MASADAPAFRDAERQRLRLEIAGAVQGVGFRPLVCRLARQAGLAGHVRNTPAGVTIEVEGAGEALELFLDRLKHETRPPAEIHQFDVTPCNATGESEFAVVPSSAAGARSAVVLPDLATCDECRDEIFDAANRRYRYAFTACTRCGPRYSIIEAPPYDRARTAMRQFPMCAACRAEYDDPASRRFHAEINACPDCGPQLVLRSVDGAELAAGSEALDRAARALRGGRIVALKGLGGFQLLADARNQAAVDKLRRRKNRPSKPLAIMVRSLVAARALAEISPQEEELLLSPAAPIVLLRASVDSQPALASGIAPANPDIGIMLPATPLHHLLMAELEFPIVATSGNVSGEPLAASDAEAFARLAGIADLFLTHDRPILHRVDDSIVRVIAAEACVIRNARGLAPLMLADPEQASPLMALGGHLKSSIALTRGDGQIVLGAHIGDLDSVPAREVFGQSLETTARLFGVDGASLACDTHPDYHSTRIAAAGGPPVAKAPHHLAHVLAGMIDNALSPPLLGVAWDGAGLGTDGALWGGEFLAVGRESWRRLASFEAFPLPGGERAMREPRRAALGALYAIHGGALWDRDDLLGLCALAEDERKILPGMLAHGVNSPPTSSVGRLFDAVAALLGLCRMSSFEGEAAMAVEFAARRATVRAALPPPEIVPDSWPLTIDWRSMLDALATASLRGVPADAVAAGFHDWLARAILLAAREAGIDQIVLSGGCFQNSLLTDLAMRYLREGGFRPYNHRRVPPNDGGLAAGQVAFVARALTEETGRCALPFPANS